MEPTPLLQCVGQAYGMHHVTHRQTVSLALARCRLLPAAVLAMAGSGRGVMGMGSGTVSGAERWLVSSCLLGATGLLVALLVVPRARLQTRAALATGYGAASLGIGALRAVIGTTDNLDFPHAIGLRGQPMGLSCCEQLTPGFPVATRPLADVWSPALVSNNSNNINGLGFYHAIRVIWVFHAVWMALHAR